MIAFQWLTISMILIVLSLIHIDALKHRSVRQTTINKCLTPDIPICDFVQCGNGSCVKDENSLNCYQCKCSPGYVGQLCDETIVLPSSCNPVCQNGGTCVMNGAAYTCSCATGWTGPICDIPEHNCPIGFCQNGGTCRMDGMNPYCNCPTIYTGQRCETLIPGTTTTPSTTITTQYVNPCNPNPCYNEGACFRHGNSYVCVCKSQFTGSLCEVPRITTTPAISTIRCTSQPCQNGGTCFDSGNSYFCYCGPNGRYTGKNCEIVNAPSVSNCPLNCAPGYCVNTGVSQNAYACICNGVMTPTRCPLK
ncbi:unnamed protein product [Rotaria sordida]|uniref:EGF-like domain-containing protein n=1 Tax=Rotaria sordida TaxID=392033 RepID=A0A813WRF7_9BILA|nr:unnamed protein product [Rotaria sordida]CAF0897606.1 unnamed protein product [Rotaria sordida]CAF0902639.1 unnamed protein product [Rotaria sordida]